MRLTRKSIICVACIVSSLFIAGCGGGGSHKPPIAQPVLSVRTFDANTNSIAADPSRHLIYATVPVTDPTHPSSFVAYNPTTGSVVKSLALPTEPYVIALSDDYQFAYVSQNTVGKVIRVDLSTFTVGLSFPLSSTRTDSLFQMKVRPQHPTQVAISHFLNGGSESELTIYDNGVPEANIDHSIHTLAFASASVLYGGQFGAMTAYIVDDTGVTPTKTGTNSPGHSYAYLDHAGGQLFLNTYDVIDGTTLSVLGTFPGKLKNSLVVPDPTSG